FRSMRNSPTSAIYVMNADGKNVTRISDPNGNALNAAISPDNNLVAYQSTLDGDNDIYVYDLQSGGTRKLTDNSVSDYAPTWVCKGSVLVFTSNITGDSNLFSTAVLPMSGNPLNI